MFEEETDGYSVLNLSGNWMTSLLGNDLNIFWSIDNVFDKEYYDHLKNIEKPIFLERSKNLSGDKSLAIEVWKNAIEFLNKDNNKYNFSLFLEPTSPIRNTSWIK